MARTSGRADRSTHLGPALAGPVLLVGLAGGLLGAAYLTALRLVADRLGPAHHTTATQAAVLVSVGIAVTLLTRWLGESGNVELLVDNIHVLGGAEDLRQVRPLLPTSLLCVGAGGTMGPEAPLVQASGALGTWTAGRYELDADDMRILTITGMAAGFSVLFGAPLGAALFALEILHRGGLQYYEALVPALVGALSGFAVYLTATGIGLEPVWQLPAPGPRREVDLLWGVVCGVLGAGGAFLFVGATAAARRAVGRVPVDLLPPLSGILLALLAVWSPFALTNGEAQVDAIVAGRLTAGALAVAMAAKLAGVVVTLTGRWKGGFIIPLFFLGITGGALVHRLIPSADVTLVMVALAVALCVGVTKTPLGSTLVVTQMAGLAVLPTALIAALVALVLTDRATVIETQRSRP